MLFSPFFWLFNLSACDSENRYFFTSLSEGKNHFVASYLHSLKFIIVNLGRLVKYYLAGLIKPGNFKRKNVVGTINSQTSVIITAWLRSREELARLGNQKELEYWGDLFKELTKRKINYQVILTPFFKLTKDEIASIVEEGYLLIAPFRYEVPVRCLLETVEQILLTAYSAIKFFKRIDWTAAYLVSLLNIRTLYSHALFKEIGLLIENKNIQKVLIPWEAHPEQRAVVAAFRACGAEVFGYIHSSVSNNPIYLAKLGEKFFKRLYPDKLFVHGKDIAENIKLIGWTDEEIIIVRTQRFKKRNPNDFSGCFFLPYAVENSKNYLKLAKELVDKGVINIAQVKLHPLFKDNKELISLASQIPLDISSSKVVVGGFTSVILEALECGLEIVQIAKDDMAFIGDEFYPSIERKKLADSCYMLSLPPDKRGHLIEYDGSHLMVDYI